MKNSNFPLLLMLAAIVMLNTDCSKPWPPPPPSPPVVVVPNSSPRVNAGPDKALEIPITQLKFAMSIADPDNNLTSYTFKKITGPNSGYFSFDGLSSATADLLEEGIYDIELTATDYFGLSAKDTVRITVTSNFQKFIRHAMMPDAFSTAIVEIPGDIYKSLKWVYGRQSGYCFGMDKGSLPGIDYSWGGWYYELLPDNKLFVFGGPPNEKFDLIIYY